MKLQKIAIGAGLCFVLAASLLVVGPTEVEALPTNEIEHVWIDADGNVVGNFVRDCSGNSYSEGVQSERRLTHSEACYSGPSSVRCYFNNSSVSCSSIPFYGVCIYWGLGWDCQH